MKEWDNYIQKNKYSECQLITALNAYYYLTGKYIKQDSKRYETLVDLAGARHGSAICIEKVWDKLGVKVIKESNSILDFICDKKALFPIEYSIWHKRYGFHSTLIVDYEPKSDAVRITNFDKVTTFDGWIFREDLYQFETTIGGHRKTYRLFGKVNRK